ncbi:MAG: rRNA maturation RNase YbeY [Actinobacteria bacterium]|nr:rRNA maturation RNase YbeY [Actinomycetota bacterium]
MEVFIANEQDISIDEGRLSELAQHLLTVEEMDATAELSVLFITEDHMRQLNAHYAGHDYATDVLAFPMGEDDDGQLLLGDVVICPQIARQNALERGRQVREELDMLLVHGTLHLLGYDHGREEEKNEMDKRLWDVLGSFVRSDR